MFPFSDISEAQGSYNMAANTDQLIAIRMSTGALMRFDHEAAKNYSTAHAAGKLILQYHYAGNNDPTAEANLFLAACHPFAENDLYCLDPELAESKDWCNTFDAVVFAATGCHVIDYGNITWANNVGASPDCALWLAAPSWGFNQTITELHSGITYIMQQGPIVNGVDSDMCFISLDTLKKYAYHVAAQPAPAPVPTPAPPVATAPTPPTSTPSPAPPVTLPITPPTPVTPPASTGQGSGTNSEQPIPHLPVVLPETPKPVSFWGKVLLWIKTHL